MQHCKRMDERAEDPFHFLGMVNGMPRRGHIKACLGFLKCREPLCIVSRSLSGKIALTTALLTVMTFPQSASGVPSSTARPTVDYAYQLERERQWSSALTVYRSIAPSIPRNTTLRDAFLAFHVGLFLMRVGKLEQAREWWIPALALYGLGPHHSGVCAEFDTDCMMITSLTSGHFNVAFLILHSQAQDQPVGERGAPIFEDSRQFSDQIAPAVGLATRHNYNGCIKRLSSIRVSMNSAGYAPGFVDFVLGACHAALGQRKKAISSLLEAAQFSINPSALAFPTQTAIDSVTELTQLTKGL